MKKIALAVAFVIAALSISGCASTSSSVAPSSSDVGEEVEYEFGGEYTPSSDNVRFADGKFVFSPIENALFTMEFQPVNEAPMVQLFGLNFPNGYDCTWVSDSSTISSFVFERFNDPKQYGTVTITTAPADLAAAYGTTDPDEQINQMKASYFTAEDKYNGLKKNIVEDFGYELVEDYYGAIPFNEAWTAYYFEFIDQDAKTRNLRFYICDNEINSNFYAIEMSVTTVLGEEDEIFETYRDVIFTLHPREA